MCEFDAADKIAFETHLFTCEVYVCNSCDNKSKTIADLKAHVVGKHEKDYVLIYFSKQDRTNNEKLTETSYQAIMNPNFFQN